MAYLLGQTFLTLSQVQPMSEHSPYGRLYIDARVDLDTLAEMVIDNPRSIRSHIVKTVRTLLTSGFPGRSNGDLCRQCPTYSKPRLIAAIRRAMTELHRIVRFLFRHAATLSLGSVEIKAYWLGVALTSTGSTILPRSSNASPRAAPRRNCAAGCVRRAARARLLRSRDSCCR